MRIVRDSKIMQKFISSLALGNPPQRENVGLRVYSRVGGRLLNANA